MISIYLGDEFVPPRTRRTQPEGNIKERTNLWNRLVAHLRFASSRDRDRNNADPFDVQRAKLLRQTDWTFITAAS